MISYKDLLKAVADQYYMLGVNAHAEGIAHMQLSARIELMGRACGEELAKQYLDTLVREGLVVIEDDAPVVAHTDPKVN